LKREIVIIGAGLTGLSAALHLARGGCGVTVLEASETVGGRMNSRIQDGFIIDAGFQISLSSYPMLREICTPWEEFEERVKPRPFWSGARIFRGAENSDIHVYNPILHPYRFISTIGSSRGLPNLLSYRNVRAALQLLPWMVKALKSSHSSIREVIERVDFSPELRDSFLFPFLKGVLLDPTLSVDAALAGLLLKYFAVGDAVLFTDGACSLPKYLKDLLPPNSVHLSKRCMGISRVENGFSVTINKDGHTDSILADGVIVTVPLFGDTLESLHNQATATLRSFVLDLFPQLEKLLTHSRNLSSRTVLFSATTPPYQEPLLTLNGSGEGETNHLSVLTNIQPSYAPAGCHLIAVCTNSGSTASVESLKKELATWFPQGRTSTWRCIDDSTVNYALPSSPLLENGYLVSDGLVVAGDGLSYGSQNGALLAGKRAAQCML
jgi:phytoene dehydrogenase-like protein